MMLSRLAITAAALLACAVHAQQSVILVRHAELGDAAGIDAKAVPLSSEGQARAERLAKMLERSGVKAAYATDFQRTRATAEPAAKLLKHEVLVVSQDDPREFVERLRKEHANDVVLVVGHSDTVPGIIKALGVREDARFDKQDFGNLFIVTPRPGSDATLVRLRY
jgi:broad specificity phosphatase PhoE